MLRLFSGFLLPFLSLLSVLPAYGLTVYTSRSNWQNAMVSFAQENFESQDAGPSDPGPNVYGPFTATIDSNSSSYTGIVEPGAVNGSRDFQARISTNAPFDPSFVQVDLAAPVYGIGADFVGTIDGDLLTVTIGSETIEFDQHLTGAGDGFFGVVSSQAFAQLTFNTENPTASGEAFSVDNVVFGPLAYADYNGNKLVDAPDFFKWQRGETAPPLSPSALQLWQAQYGLSVPSGLQAVVAAVPEPAAWVLAVACLSMLLVQRPSASGA